MAVMSEIVNSVVQLGKSGCKGTTKDFHSWLQKYDANIDQNSVQEILDGLKSDGIFISNPESPRDYLLAQNIEFPDEIHYIVSSEIKLSPIQMVRSRMESFLNSRGVENETVVDIMVGITEAMENAVKYSDQNSPINVFYSLLNGKFSVKITNVVVSTSPEDDIEMGKYRDGNITLMRGMMVMTKLFDEMDLDISDDGREAVFSAVKVVQ